MRKKGLVCILIVFISLSVTGCNLSDIKKLSIREFLASLWESHLLYNSTDAQDTGENGNISDSGLISNKKPNGNKSHSSGPLQIDDEFDFSEELGEGEAVGGLG